MSADGPDFLRFLKVRHPLGGLSFYMYMSMRRADGKFCCASIDEVRALQPSRMFRADGGMVYPGCVGGTVSQHVRQFDGIPGSPEERCCEQMPEVAGEYLGRLHPGPFAQRFHPLLRLFLQLNTRFWPMLISPKH